MSVVLEKTKLSGQEENTVEKLHCIKTADNLKLTKLEMLVHFNDDDEEILFITVIYR